MVDLLLSLLTPPLQLQLIVIGQALCCRAVRVKPSMSHVLILGHNNLNPLMVSKTDLVANVHGVLFVFLLFFLSLHLISLPKTKKRDAGVQVV